MKILTSSEKILIGLGFSKAGENKMFKYDILMEVLNYYVAAVNQPSCLLDFMYMKDLFRELKNINWKSQTSEAFTFVCFINRLVDKGTESG